MPIAGQSSHRGLCTIHARAPDVAVVVEPATNNARRLFAGVDIAAPVAVVWDSLTDYDGLGNFIPGRSSVSSVSHMLNFYGSDAWTSCRCYSFCARCTSWMARMACTVQVWQKTGAWREGNKGRSCCR